MIFDIVVLVILLISALIAFLRGVIREILTIAGVVGGLLAAYFLGPVLIPVMYGWLGVEQNVEPERLFGALPYDVLGDGLSYALIFIVVVLVLSLTSHFLAEGVRTLGLGAVDRTLGFIFGILRGVILIGLLYLPVYLFMNDADTQERWFGTSQTHFYVEQTSAFLAGFLPETAIDDAEERVEDKTETLKSVDETRKMFETLSRPFGDGDAGSARPTGQQGEGYSEEFRNNMDALFEDGAVADPSESDSSHEKGVQ